MDHYVVGNDQQQKKNSKKHHQKDENGVGRVSVKNACPIKSSSVKKCAEEFEIV